MRAHRGFIGLLLAMLLAACGGTPPPTPPATPLPSPTPPPTPTPIAALLAPVRSGTTPTSRVRLVHAAPSVGPLDVQLNTAPLTSNLAFASTTSALDAATGDYTFSARPGATPPDAIPLLTEPLSISADANALLILTEQDDALRLLNIPEPLGPIDGGQARILLVNAWPGSPGVTLSVGGEARTGSVGFGQAAAPFELPAGPLIIDVSPFISGYTLNARPETAYTFVLTGSPTAPQLVAYDTPLPGRATLQWLHAAPTLPDATFRTSPASDAASAAFGTLSDPQTIPAAALTLSVSTSGDTPLAETTLRASSGGRYIAALIGDDADTRLVVFADDRTPLEPLRARVLFLNAAPSAPRAQLVGLDTFDVPTLLFGTEPIQRTLLGEARTFRWSALDPGNDERTLEDHADVPFAPGTRTLYVLTGQGTPLLHTEEVGIATEPTPPPPATSLQFVHALLGTDAVDFAVNGQPVAATARPGDTSARLTFTPGDLTIEARDPRDGAVLAATTLPAAATQTQIVVLSRQGNDAPSLITLPSTDDAPLGATAPLLRLVNLRGPGTPPVRLLSSDQPIPAEQLALIPPESDGGLPRLPIAPSRTQRLGPIVAQGQASDVQVVPADAGLTLVVTTYDAQIDFDVTFAALQDVSLAPGARHLLLVLDGPTVGGVLLLVTEPARSA